MKFVKIDDKYCTEEGRYEIVKDWTSARMKLVQCWKIFKRGEQVKTCRTLGEAKDFVKLMYC